MNTAYHELRDKKKTEWLCWIILMMTAVIFNIRSSCFSPINSLVECKDPAIFYMCGKAWYHGFIPYIDIVDVKGPLLFSIFLLGQYISPDDTLGIFILQCVFTWLTLCASYKTAFIFLKNSFPSVLAAILLLFVIGQESTWGGGCQSELFILPFGAWLIYAFTAFLYNDGISRKSTYLIAFISGMGAAGALLIKFNTIFPFLTVISLCLLILCSSSSNRKYLLPFTGICAASFLLLVAPYTIWMHEQGNLTACMHWYFFVNVGTYFGSETSMVSSAQGTLSSIINYLIIAIKSSLRDPVAVLSTMVIFAPCFKYNASTRPYLRPCLILLLIISFIISSYGLFLYYRIFESIIFIFPAITLLGPWNEGHTPKSIKWALTIFSVAILWGYNLVNEHKDRVTIDPGIKSSHYQAEELLNKEKYKTVLYWGCLDAGYGKHALLPAIPLYTRHNGSTTDMDKTQIEAIQNRIPDFVFAAEWIEKLNPSLLDESGYEKLTDIPSPDDKKTSKSLWHKKSITVKP